MAKIQELLSIDKWMPSDLMKAIHTQRKAYHDLSEEIDAKDRELRGDDGWLSEKDGHTLISLMAHRNAEVALFHHYYDAAERRGLVPKTPIRPL
jgi:hypothetical protein